MTGGRHVCVEAGLVGFSVLSEEAADLASCSPNALHDETYAQRFLVPHST